MQLGQMRLRPPRPSLSQLEGSQGFVSRRGIGCAFVEHHNNVRAERSLNLHRSLRREDVARAVQVRLKLDAFFAQLSQVAEAEDLIAAAIGQDRTFPGSERVQAAQLVNGEMPGPQIEVIGIPQNDAGSCLFKAALRESFDASLCADRHEYRRIERTVRSGNAARSGL